MLHAKHMPLHFLVEALNTLYHIHNRVVLRPGTANTILWNKKGDCRIDMGNPRGGMNKVY